MYVYKGEEEKEQYHDFGDEGNDERIDFEVDTIEYKIGVRVELCYVDRSCNL